MPKRRKAPLQACPPPASSPPHKHDHPHEAPQGISSSPRGECQITLRAESEPRSRTGVAYRAYYTSDNVPLYLGSETERDARRRVLDEYPFAIITVEAQAKKACCDACAQGKACQSGCSSPRRSFEPGFAGEAGEALLAVYEGEGAEEVVGCGSCNSAMNVEAHPALLRFEKARKNPIGGGVSFETAYEAALSPQLQSLYSQGGACRGAACMPWVRIQRDPERFRTALQAARKLGPVTSSKAFYNFVKDHMTSEDQEVFYVLMLDVHFQIRGIGEISRGARDRVLTPVPDVLRLPLVDGATAFIVAHNHPSGKAKPSEADKEVTKEIKKGADAVGILMLDHIVVGADGYYSFADHGLV